MKRLRRGKRQPLGNSRAECLTRKLGFAAPDRTRCTLNHRKSPKRARACSRVCVIGDLSRDLFRRKVSRRRVDRFSNMYLLSAKSSCLAPKGTRCRVPRLAESSFSQMKSRK